MNIAAVHKALVAEGIPILGVSAGPPLRIDFAPEATEQQRRRAAVIAGETDTRKRKPRPLAAIAADINALTVAEQRKLTLAIQAKFLQQNPGFARELLFALDGDEPE